MADNQLIKRVNIADIEDTNLSKYDPKGVCFGRIRDIIITGILNAKTIPDIQKELIEKTGIELPLDKIDRILDKYVAGITAKEETLIERLRWEQNQRTLFMISKVMNLIERAENSPQDASTPKLLKSAVTMLDRLHTRQAKLFGLDAEQRRPVESAKGGLTVNFNLAGFDPNSAGYPKPPEITVDAEYTEEQS